LSPDWNCCRLMVGERRCSGKEFHVLGAATRKLRLPNSVFGEILFGGVWVIPCNRGYVSPGGHLIVTVLQRQLPWQRYALS